MITFSPINRVKKNDPKRLKSSANYSTNIFAQTANLHATSETDTVNQVFLDSHTSTQLDFDQQQNEQQLLESYSEKAFNELKKLQLSLLTGKITQANLEHLNNLISKDNIYLQRPDLRDLAEQITLRIEVEIAKIEKINKSQG